MKKPIKIDKNAVSYFDMSIRFMPMDFGSAVWDMFSGSGIGYTIKGKIDADTPFGAMKLPISQEGGTTCIKNDLSKIGCRDNEYKFIFVSALNFYITYMFSVS